MNMVILDGATINPGDLSWSPLKDFGTLDVYLRSSYKNALERGKNANIILTSKVLIDKEFIDYCPSLKMICVLATGYNNVDVEYAKSKDILVCNIPTYSSEIVAQHTMAMILQLATFHEPAIKLQNKTLGLIGFGNISRIVMNIALAFDMNVVIATNYPDLNLNEEKVKFTVLDTLFASSDVISLHCPLTDQNKGLINKDSIAKMKKGVILINTARGGLVESEDLAQGLRSGHIGAAGLDVLEKEPPREGNPLIGLPNTLITPHIAWSSKSARSRLITYAINNVKGFLSKNPVNVV